VRSQGRPKTKEKGNETMKTMLKIITYPAFALFAFACFALSPTAKAQLQQPAPDGAATVTSTDVADTEAPLLAPNKTVFNYSLAPGANQLITPIVANKPVLVMGVCTSSGDRGVGQVTLLHIPGFFIEWTGLESPSGASITSGYDGPVGHHIVYLDYFHQVDIQVAGPDTIRVHNGSSLMRTGNVTLIW
jgi:hypothetical protein